MSLPKYKYYIRRANGSDFDYYYVDTSGSVTFTTSSTPTQELPHAPTDWQDQFLEWARGFRYYGIIRALSKTIRFTKEAAKILRSEYYTNGIQTGLQLYIEIKDPNDWSYDPYYKGDLTFNGSRDDFNEFPCEVSESGFLQKLEAHETTDYQVAVDGNASKIWVKMHTMYLEFRQRWETSANQVFTRYPLHIVGESEGPNLYLSTYQQDELGAFVNMLSNNTSSSKTVNLLYQYNYYIDVDSGAFAGGAPYRFHLFFRQIEIATTLEEAQYTIFKETSPSNWLLPGANHTWTGAYTQSITIPAGRKLLVEVTMEATAGPPGDLNPSEYTAMQVNGSYCQLSYDQATEEGYFPALYWRDVTSNLINQMNGSSVTLSSAVFSEYPNWVLSPGDAIRNLPSSFLKTNFADDFASINAKAGAAFRYDADTNTAYLDKKADVFQDVEILDLGEVAEFSQEPFTQEMFSTVKIGQANQTYDEVNGKDEAHTEVTRTTPLNAVPAEKNMKSGYRSDPMGALMTFLNLNGKTVTDADSDNDVFIFHIGSSVAGTIPAGYPGAGEDYYDLYIDPTWSVTNVYRGDVLFNIELAPLVSFMRSGDYVHGLMYGQDSSFIEWRSSAKSNSAGTKMQYTIGSVTYDEGADILISDLADPLFKPMVATVKTKVPVDLYSTLATNAYGYVKFTWLGNEYNGFIIKASQQPTTEEAQQFKLLLTASTDVSNLIR